MSKKNNRDNLALPAATLLLFSAMLAPAVTALLSVGALLLYTLYRVYRWRSESEQDG